MCVINVLFHPGTVCQDFPNNMLHISGKDRSPDFGLRVIIFLPDFLTAQGALA